ncbi:MAG: 2-C-methyl-D-erythritol 2,4-cyclodiphosphate synthase [Bacteroidales bacterium]|nr:2-C-methyl-D-erythritol 2,4-cyclodiphosphate synthase [Bacteroidales bacterium]
MGLRIGLGYDVHAFAENRDLFLGGIKIPHHKGLIGHSDADVLLHAISDALLGSLALGDIGLHFPDTEDSLRGIDSKILLKECYSLVKAEGYTLVNLDCVLILEKPKVKYFIPEMRETIAGILETSIQNISVKATTTEKLGFTGREEGIAAEALVMVEKDN